MASGDVYRVSLEVELNLLTRAQWTFGLVEGTGLGGPNRMEDVATHVESALAGDPLTGFSANAQLTAIQVSDVQPGTAGGFRLGLSGLAGDVVGDMLPPQDALVCRLSTGLKGKANNGRIYLAGFAEAGQVAGFWQSVALDAASAFISLLFNEYVNDGTVYQWHIISYVPESSPRVLRAAVPVTAFTLDNVVRTVRSRQPGRGQ